MGDKEGLPKVAVLLATHNPETFVKEQIESIKNQQDVQIKIYWGDYKSPIQTRDFVRSLLQDVEFEEHQINSPGPAANFFFLLERSQEDWIAFADQDDIWLPNKLKNQIEILNRSIDRAALIHSKSVMLKNSKLLGRTVACDKHDLLSLMIRNCCQGCTMMINANARRQLLQKLPDDIPWHDWWIALVISVIGDIYLTEEIQVHYRIHVNNTIGLPSNFQRLLNFINRPSGYLSFYFHRLLEIYGFPEDYDETKKKIILGYFSKSMKSRIFASLLDIKTTKPTASSLIRKLLFVLKYP